MIDTGIQVKLGGLDCKLMRAQYDNKRTALQLVEAATDEPYARVTINVPEHPLAADEVVIKTYAENEGVVECLVAAEVLSAMPSRIIELEHAKVPVYKLLLPEPAEPIETPGCPCVACDRKFVLETEFKDELSRRDFAITGLCQVCQDATYREEDEE